MLFAFLACVTATPESIIKYFQEHGVLWPKTNPFSCLVENCGKGWVECFFKMIKIFFKNRAKIPWDKMWGKYIYFINM